VLETLTLHKLQRKKWGDCGEERKWVLKFRVCLDLLPLQEAERTSDSVVKFEIPNDYPHRAQKFHHGAHQWTQHGKRTRLWAIQLFEQKSSTSKRFQISEETTERNPIFGAKLAKSWRNRKRAKSRNIHDNIE
jgi:hypothetical protein